MGGEGAVMSWRSCKVEVKGDVATVSFKQHKESFLELFFFHFLPGQVLGSSSASWSVGRRGKHVAARESGHVDMCRCVE